MVILGAAILIPFPATTIAQLQDSEEGQATPPPPIPLPKWFNDLDTDGDGQVTVQEWRNAGKPLGEFRKFDLNGDGIITADEVRRTLTRPAERKPNNRPNANLPDGLPPWFRTLDRAGEGQITFARWRSAGKPQGEFRKYDLNGDGIITAEEVLRYLKMTAEPKKEASTRWKGLPAWFRSLDGAEQGQITLARWKNAGRPLDMFNTYDLNGDGIITAEEVLRYLKNALALKLTHGLATYAGSVEEADEVYQSKKSFKTFTIKFEAGKTYQIDHTSKAFQAYLFLENTDGEILRENSSPNIGGKSRIVFHVETTGTYRIIATSLGGFKTGDFLLSVLCDPLPKELPPWFKELDKDGAGQVTMQQWREAGHDFAEFRKYDLNGDGILTVAEVLHFLKDADELMLKGGQTIYFGTLEQTDEAYRGKTSLKILRVKLEPGKTYQIDHVSQAYQASLYLEDAEGNPLEENNSPNIGGNSRIIFRAEKAGIYRIIATSLGGFKPGDFWLSVHRGSLPRGIPSWFYDVDKDGDGQVTFREWREAGYPVSAFRQFDLNGDGIITAEEILRYLKMSLELKLKNGQATYFGALDQSEEPYRDKKSFKILTIKLEAGKTYQIDHISAAYQAFLYLEDSEGNLLVENSSSRIGEDSRVVVHVERAGTYRIIATSLGGYKPGEFSLSVRLVDEP
jgi:Ca2+-binding EF-hand superfamily protein